MNKRRHVAAAATAAALALTVAACSGSGDKADSPDSSSTALTHIHGLGVDPSDQRLYVATHEGVYTAGVNGKPTLVGASKDDYMGFTVAGDKTFFASGHPSQGGNQGLIKSTDAGKTWTALSLAGQSDFHALEYAHDTLYAYDATHSLLRVSQDGKTWKNGSTLQALDIAVSPSDPDLVLATIAEGVARSTDGGKTFTRGKQPVMAFLSWKSKAALFGIDTSGGLKLSLNGGATWKNVSTVPGGQPQALTALDARHLLAATQDGVYESKDGGETFTKRLALESADVH
ncbi:F510_1955 family glycosylhydrolase [Streptomyces sp. NPDC001260]|uniref:F510_1955 family glycosylhydrolase n=1 Tax=Streptomyces sp. NPDC001260 TaxID=3364551 RepID=UPI00368A0EB2